MSKFIINLLVQIFKICQKSEIQIKFEKVLLLELGPAPVFSPAAAHFLFPSPTGRSPSPKWASTSRPAQPTARRWRSASLPPPSRGNASPHAAFTPLYDRLTGGPHLSSPSSGSARARLHHRHISPPPTTTQHLEMSPPCRYSPPPPTINPPLTPHYAALPSMETSYPNLRTSS
jgi:hypothetical protein